MINTRSLFGQIIEEIDSKEADYFEEINSLDDRKALNDYLTTFDSKVHDIYSLLDYANSIKSNMDRILFERFCFFVFGSEEETNTFFQELKNLSLLKRTGLMKYANDQEIRSRQMMSNFLLKLDQFRLDVCEKNPSVDLYETTQKLARLNRYKLYFSPIGIVHEVENSKDFNCFLEELDIPKKDKFQILLMAFEFNQMAHEAELKKYLPDLPMAKEMIRFRYYMAKEDADKISMISDIPSVLSKKKEDLDYLPKKEEEKEFSFVEDNNEDMEERFLEANKQLKEHSKEDPYVLFNDYYNTLLSQKKKKEEPKMDATILTKAQQYFDSHKFLVENLNDIAREDLEQTVKIYQRDEDLREEVYKTTQYIDRLITYEIKTIFESIDANDPENVLLLIEKLKPCVEYLEKNEKKNHKK